MPESSNSIQRLWNSLLDNWTSTGFLARGISSAFGIEINSEKVKSVTDQLLDKGSKLSPDLVELSSANMKNHWGAYSPQTNSIYVDSNLKFYPDLAKEVLAHELGHWVESRLNQKSVTSEVLQTFSSILLGKELSTNDPLNGYKSNLDPQSITLADGSSVPVQFFDTSIHVSWVPLLPNLSADAKSLLQNAQNETDAFNSGSRTYGLQTNSASHFDNNNITGGLTAIRSRYEDAIKQFYNTTSIPLVDADSFTGGNNRSDATPNPAFSGVWSGVQLLLYRFGQICHTLEDFYSHTNWVELSQNGALDKSKLFLEGNGLPSILKAGDFIPGTDVVLAMAGPNWSQYLKKSSTGSYSGTDVDVYFNVDSDLMYFDESGKGGVITAKTLDGRTIYGLASGGTGTWLYKDNDYNVYMEDPTKTAWSQEQYFRGLGHGGIAGSGSGQRMSPINKDNDQALQDRYSDAAKLAQLQVQNEWNRLGNLIFANYGKLGLERFAAYAINSPSAREDYVKTFSTYGGVQTFIDPSIVDGVSTKKFAKENFIVPNMNNWLASVDSNLYYTEIGLTYSHDAAAFFTDSFLIAKTKWANNQGPLTLYDQFVGGTRLFDIRTSPESVADRDTFRLDHNGYQVGEINDEYVDSKELFRELFQALAENPSEFIGFQIGVYGEKYDIFNANNKGTHFWDTTAGKNIHSYFFKDGSHMMSNNPREWGDDVFAEWGLDKELSEEQKQQLRGKPLFYVPHFGIEYPTIPKLDELRGKFMWADEAGFSRLYLEDNGKVSLDDQTVPDVSFDKVDMKSLRTLANEGSDEDKKYVDGYLNDMKEFIDKYGPNKVNGPKGFQYYDRLNHRYDPAGSHDQYGVMRWNLRNTMDKLVNYDPSVRKVSKEPSFVGAYTTSDTDIILDGPLEAANHIWHYGGFPYDDGSPSFKDVILNGKNLIKPLKVGDVSGLYFTDASAIAYEGKSPASIIAEMQPRVVALVSSENFGDMTIGNPNGLMKIDLRTNIPDDSEEDSNGRENYGVEVRLLSESLRQKPTVVAGYGLSLQASDRMLLATENTQGNLHVIVPKGDETATEYISVQVKNLRTGELRGAPVVYSLPPLNAPSVPLIRSAMLYSALDTSTDRQSSLNSTVEYGNQFFDVESGKWLDTDYRGSIHSEINATDASLIGTPSKLQHLLAGKRAVYISEGPTSLGGISQTFNIDISNANVPVYLNDFDLGHDRFAFVDELGNTTVLNEDLYQPSSYDLLIKDLESRNVHISFRPLTDYSRNSIILNASQLKSPLKVSANSFAQDIQGSSISFSAYDGSIPFLSLDNGLLVQSGEISDYLSKSYSALVDISNGTSVARNVLIKVAIDPKVTINGDIYATSDNFSVDLNLTDQSFTIYSRIINDPKGLAKFMPFASSIGLASGLPVGFKGSALEIGLGDLVESGSVEFWIEDSLGAFKQLDVLTDSASKYSLKLDGKSIGTLQASSPLSDVPNLKAITSRDQFYDGLGFDLTNKNDNLAPKSDGTHWNVAISYDLYTEAVYSNTIGFYLFDKQYGAIVDPVTGNRVEHRSAEWWKDAERLSVWSAAAQNTSAPSSISFMFNGSIDPDAIALLPYIKVNDGSSSVFYSTFDSLNSDMSSHMKSLGRTAIGFEDKSKISSSGYFDGDFDDVIFNMRTFSLI